MNLSQNRFRNFGNNNDLSIFNKGHRHAFSFYSNINNNVTNFLLQFIPLYDIISTSENNSKKGLIVLKRAISLLLILTTILGCCAVFFACKKDEDDITKVVNIANSSAVVIDINSAGLNTGTGKGDGEPAAKWTVGKNASSRILTLDLAEKGLSAYKEVTFWMNNTGSESIPFQFYFIAEDGTKYRAAADLDFPWFERDNGSMHDYNYAETIDVGTVYAHPGWHLYSFPLDEVDVLTGGRYNPNDDNGYHQWTYDEDTGVEEIQFDKSKIVSIQINMSDATNVLSDIDFHIGSVNANTNKYGTIRGFGVSKLTNSVAFYKQHEAYMYNQNRYHLTYNEADKLGMTGDSVFVPVAILAQHKGATNLVSTKENVSFDYNGTHYEFKAGDTYTYISDEYNPSAGLTVTGGTSSIGDYLTIPMEVAAEALGYELFVDVSGLVIFSDRHYPTETGINDAYWEENWENVSYVNESSELYYDGGSGKSYGRQLKYISQIVKIICFDYYTGEELIEDMNNLHGEDAHGKLIVTDEQIEKLKGLVETDSVYRSWFTAFEAKYAKGTSLYTAKLPTFYLADGQRMSSDNAEHIENYAFLYRMTGNEDYAARVVTIMKALLKYRDWVSEAKSWHPEHFLDCAKPMLYYAIGYDWCYDYIAKDEKLLKQIEDGAWEFAYGAAMGHGELYEWWSDLNNLKVYREKAAVSTEDDIPPAPWGNCRFPYNRNEDDRWGSASYNNVGFSGNWNAVCNGGMIQIAFAFANASPLFKAASEYILSYAVNDTTYAMVDCYGADGGHPEGPGYWYFGTKDQLPMLLTIKNCTGSYHGLEQFMGFEDSYYYVLGMASPNKLAWNYHDCAEGTSMPISDFFAAAYLHNWPELAQFKMNYILSRGGTVYAYDLMFYDPAICYENSNVEFNLDYVSYKIGMTTFRSSWSNSYLYAGLHGGANNAGHGQIDIGTFILEYSGVRFFGDLGSDNYICPGYFSFPARHWLYVNRAEGHNTLVIDPEKVDRKLSKWGKGGQYMEVWNNDWAQRSLDGFNYDQAYSAISMVKTFRSGKTSAYSVIDMGCAYGWYNDNQSALQSADKMVSLDGVRGLLVTDNRSTAIIQDEMDISLLNTRRGKEKTKHTVVWNGHIIKGGTINITDDGQAALITYNGMSLLCEIVVPDGYPHSWKFEARSADYLRETGLVQTPGEYSRDGKQKLVAIAEIDTTLDPSIKLAVVCRLLSAGPHSYEWTDIADWDQFID